MMRFLTMGALLCIGAVTSIEQVAKAAPCAACRAAPVPAIGSGVPAAPAVGAVLLGASLLRRRGRSQTTGA
jgi:hypothetical protein